MTKELIDYHKTKMCLAGAEGRTEDYKFHKAAIELFEKLSLPSDLDEAAQKVEDYYDVGDEHGYLYCHRGDIKDAFKAGAEWMAGQFVLVGGEPTGWFRANDGSEYATGLDLKEPIKLPVDFYVRKK